MTRSRRIARAFPLWYAISLATTLGSVESARALRDEAEAAPPPAPIRAEAVFAVPPKPDAAARPATGDGGSSEQYTMERCGSLTGAFADACFSAVARQESERDPDQGNAACDRIGDADLKWECRADVAEGHSKVDVDRSLALCERIPAKKWRDQCVFGIATAWALKDPSFALQTCEDSGQWKKFCRHDVNGERATVDPAGAVAYCESLDPALRETCWHGIGKYIGRIDPAKALGVCEGAPLEGDLRGQCVHGVGWAAAETRGSDALPLCEPLGVMRDSCVLGVAYQAKRYDPERAIGLCNQATSPAERRHCLDFVQRR